MPTGDNGNEEQEGSMSDGRLLAALSSIALAGCVSQALATDVTQQRLENAEPQNWLMVHRDYGNSRHAPLDQINRANVKDLKLKFIVSIGGTATGGALRGKE
jgi:glucose dehydrogenase